jgi:ferredoxin-type protein NapG
LTKWSYGEKPLSDSVVRRIREWILGIENPRVGEYSENRLRPPGAVTEKRFMALCIRCNRCLEVCPYGSIKRAGLSASIGTPYVFPEQKACYLCMACCRLCPTGALERDLRLPEKVAMGKARIDSSICYSHLFLSHDKLPEISGTKIAALCNTCFNVCPLQDQAITLRNNLFPEVLDGCVGCGICVERCPTRPRRAINIVPTGMAITDEAGFYFRKSRKHYEKTSSPPKEGNEKALKGEHLLEHKSKIEGSKEEQEFNFPYSAPNSIEGWD